METVVRKMRRRLKNKLANSWPRLVLACTDDPPLPDKQRWRARSCHSERPNHDVVVGFYPDNTRLRNTLHCALVVDAGELWMLVNSSARDSLVVPIRPERDAPDPADWLLESGAAFVVSVACSFREQANPRRAVIGPVSCTEIAKRTIGLHDRRIHTAAELLAELWRRHE